VYVKYPASECRPKRVDLFPTTQRVDNDDRIGGQDGNARREVIGHPPAFRTEVQLLAIVLQ
jgi:hypothetical protein